MDQDLALELEDEIATLKWLHAKYEDLNLRLSWRIQSLEGILNRRNDAKEGAAHVR
jgi:hypothetical protein